MKLQAIAQKAFFTALIFGVFIFFTNNNDITDGIVFGGISFVLCFVVLYIKHKYFVKDLK